MASFVETNGHAVDEGNFEALYETYKSDVQRLASYLLKNAADAEDAAQTVFLNVLRALRQGVTPADPRAWLLAITRNVCFSRHRAAAARPMLVELDPDDGPSSNGDETPSADEIVGALARLLPNQRTALILRDFRGVSRAEISHLMALSPVAVEALLTRARTAFREELEAGEQPFACAETKQLVEDQLDGLITVSDRHSLRSHLRHCTECSTLARAVRSSRGKLAGLVFWPVDLVSRLFAAFSQAPTVAHVATALTSTAAVATIAIPAAISTSPKVAHVEGRVAPAPAAAVAPISHHAAPAGHAAPVVTAVHSTPLVSTVTWHHAAAKAPAHTHVRAHSGHRIVHRPPVTGTPTAPSVSPSTPPSTGSGGSIHTLASPGTVEIGPGGHGITPTVSPSGPTSPSGVTLPGASAPPRSTSPASRPGTKPKSKPKPKTRPKPKASRKSAKHGKERHAPAPASQMPASSSPAAGADPSSSAGGSTAGSGTVIGATVTTSPVVAPPASAAQSTQGTKGKNEKKDHGSSGDHGKHH